MGITLIPTSLGLEILVELQLNDPKDLEDHLKVLCQIPLISSRFLAQD